MKYLMSTLALLMVLSLTACGSGGEKDSGENDYTYTRRTQETETTENAAEEDATFADSEGTGEEVEAISNAGTLTLHIYGVNQMKYVVKGKSDNFVTGESIKVSDGNSYLVLEDIKVSAGQKIHLLITNISKMPAMAMSHNWVLLNPGADMEAYAAAAIAAKDNEYIPEGKMDEVIAHTDMAGGGETAEVTFKAPDKAGNYDYLCTFPAHHAAGMKGRLIVK